MREYRFQKAVPLWANGREKEMNCELACRMLFHCDTDVRSSKPGKVVLSLAASTLYRVWINDAFVAAGPARAAHGYYRVDELELTQRLSSGDNIIVIEVVGYNVNTYDTLDQPSFLIAELLKDGVPISYTGDKAVKLYDLHQRIQRVQRYSFQRAFADCYSMSATKRSFYKEVGDNATWESLGIDLQPSKIQPAKKCIAREMRMPQFEILNVKRRLECGTADFAHVCPNPIQDRSYLQIGEMLKGFRPEELEEQLSEEGQNIAWIPTEKADAGSVFPVNLENGYTLVEFPHNATGFLRLRITTVSPCDVYVLFDELLCDGKLDFLRLQTCNCFKYKLDAGIHEIMTFAPYVMKYVKVAAKGCCTLTQLDLVEYKHPPVSNALQHAVHQGWYGDAVKAIYEAALESFRANSLDVFMDCPSRERSGWLCDSFFTARVEHVLTGETVIEKNFLENFIIAEQFPYLPKGMLPMCYPADHNNGNFIPNWAMWFVLELEEYYMRSGDRELIDRAKKRVYELLHYFVPFENEYGLLENLEKWVFVEWSRANDLDVVQDINYPSNMLYARMLRAAAKLYDDEMLMHKAERLKKVIRERSITNGYYTDNERRTENGLINPENCTEVCQYYAFFTQIATKEEDPELWEELVRDFGPKRKQTKLHPQVAYANAFIGNYLRIELLYQDKQYAQVLDNILGYFEGMAKQTGTLWEYDSPIASCNHGFASHVIYWLAGIKEHLNNTDSEVKQ